MALRPSRAGTALALLAVSVAAMVAPAAAADPPDRIAPAPADGQRAADVVDDAFFFPITPCRVLDTRATAPLAANATRDVAITGGTCGVPATATAVEASVSSVTPAGDGFARVWPAGGTPSNGTVLNYSAGKGTTNTGAVAIGETGGLTVKNFSGPSHYVIDVQGYFVPATELVGLETGSVYVPLSPCRVLDTRGDGPVAVGTGPTVRLATAPSCAVPAEATAVEASISAVTPGATGFLRAWPAGSPAPNATFLNYAAGQSTTNTGAIALSAATEMQLRVFGAPTNVVVDIQGYFIEIDDLPDGAVGATFDAFAPCRVYDSRQDPEGAFAPGETLEAELAGACGVPAGAVAAEVSLSAVTPSAPGYARVWPASEAEPNATFLNYSAGQATTNTGSVRLDAAGAVEVGNAGGPAHYTLDVQGAWRAISLEG
ncbi:MAG TPA: hypothetical protein VHK88_16730 [Aquihabitans sp.]|jgi:hypothetical protein|nr:hypothetical protein [Aquihabitans sp.]